MRPNDTNFNYFPENQLTKLAHLVQFKRVLFMSCLGVGNVAWVSYPPLLDTPLITDITGLYVKP